MATWQMRTKNGLVLIDFGDHEPTVDPDARQALESALLHCENRYEVRTHIDGGLPGYRVVEFEEDDDPGDQVGQAFRAHVVRADAARED
ncbi:MAG TPA: hypothetical protein VM305_00075 [Candidatus Limnocylindrales bacterium]|nr:hypothetical protein [Candidatus Limnocylindrales bacterium]